MILPLLLSALQLEGQASPPHDPPAEITVTAKSTLDNASVLQSARALKPGEFFWAPETAPAGPMLMVVSLETQRAVVYRNGLPIGITTVSSGKPGHETPVGIFTVLQKRKEHYSNLYNRAPMPFMQRLTWDGIALHAGKLPGHAASHGCIRLPDEFAQKLFAATKLGMTVVVTKQASLPSIAAAADLIGAQDASDAGKRMSGAFWEPSRSPSGAVSIVVSTADRSLIAIRGGRIIGRVPVTVARPIRHPYLYSFKEADQSSVAEWTRITLPGQAADEDLSAGDIKIADQYAAGVSAIITAGSTVVVTPDSLSTAATNLKDFVTS